MENAQFGSKIKNCQKHAKNHSTRTLEFFCAKNGLKKHQIFQKRDNLKIGYLAKAIAHAKATPSVNCSVCNKILKCQKHAKNHSTRTLEFFCAKNGLKKHQIFQKRDNLKIGYLAKAIAHAKATPSVNCSVCNKILKCQKHAKNHSTRTLEFFSAKNRFKKQQIFQKRENLKIGYLAKAIAHAKATPSAKCSVWNKN